MSEPTGARYLGRRHSLTEAGEHVELRDRLAPDQPAVHFPATEAGWADAVAELRRLDGVVFDPSTGRVLQAPAAPAGRRRAVAALALGLSLVLAVALVLPRVLRDDARPDGGGPASPPSLTNAEVVDHVRTSTMLVVVYDDAPIAVGSGWIYDAARGLVVTNAHVVDSGTSFRAGLPGSLAAAFLVAAAPCEDLALLQLSADAGFTAIELAPGDSVDVGDQVAALGYPPSLPSAPEATQLRWTFGAVTHGHVDVVREGLTGLVEHSARLDPGNSGGPLVDMAGRLVGVNLGVDEEHPEAGLAISVARVRSVIPDLLAGVDVCAA